MNYYWLVQSAINLNLQDNGTYAKTAHYTATINGKDYVLDLSLNEMLLPKSFAWSKYTESGELVMHKPTEKVKAQHMDFFEDWLMEK